MASRSKSAAAALTSVAAVLSCILEPPGYAVSGRISGAQAHQVTVSLSGAALGAGRTTKTDSSGAYSFDGVPKGVYAITPSLAGYHFNPASAPATVNDRDVAAMNFDGQLDDNHPADPLALQVYGRDMGSLYQNVSVVQQGVRVNDAVVKVNGVTIPHPAGWYEDGDYIGQLAAILSTGAQIVLQVTRGEKTVTAAGKVPEHPIVLRKQLRRGQTLLRSRLGSSAHHARPNPAFGHGHPDFRLRIQRRHVQRRLRALARLPGHEHPRRVELGHHLAVSGRTRIAHAALLENARRATAAP